MTIQRLSCAMMLTLLALPGLAQSVDGLWNASITNELGTLPLVIEFTVDGSQLNGTFSNTFMPKGEPSFGAALSAVDILTATRAK